MRLKQDGATWPRFLVINGTIGVLAGLSLSTALIAANIADLADLLRASIGVPAGWALLSAAFGSGYGFIAVATAIMLLAGGEQPGMRRPQGLLLCRRPGQSLRRSAPAER